MTYDKTFEIELNDIGYQVRADIEYHVEENWGADADNNRGMAKGFLDWFEIESIVDLDTQKAVEVTPELTAEVERYIDEHLSDLVEE